MGYYTEFKVELKFKQDTPEDIIVFLKKILIEKDYSIKPKFEHKFFQCDRWLSLFISTNYEKVENTKMWYDGYFKIIIHSSFKNYGNEIEEFMDWISPYVVGRKKKEYVGFFKGESMDSPINIYIERPIKSLDLQK